MQTRTNAPRIIAVANQKGGVGKTTTSINLSAALAELGHRVLVVDLDPQGNTSTGLGVPVEERALTSYELVLEQLPIRDVVARTKIQNLDVIPATLELSSADIDLVSNDNRSSLLKAALSPTHLAEEGYDYVFIDCPPSLNLLTVNALVASHSVLVPLQAEFFALEGLSQLMMTIREVRQAGNPNLRVEGIVLTMFDMRNNLSIQVEEDARENLGDLVLKTRIPRNVKLSEAPSYARPITQYAPSSAGSLAYRELAREITNRNRK